MELPKRVCESFKSEPKDGGDNLDSGLQYSTKDMGSEKSESEKNDGSNNFDAVLYESDSSTMKEAHSDSVETQSGTNNESNDESDSSSEPSKEEQSNFDFSSGPCIEANSDSSSGSLYSEVNQNKITNTNNDLSNDLTSSGSGNNGEEGNSVQEQYDSDTSSGNENLEETQTKIIIQNYGYESEAILKSTACCNLYESFKILFFSTFIVKALF